MGNSENGEQFGKQIDNTVDPDKDVSGFAYVNSSESFDNDQFIADFYRKLRKFPPQARELVSDVSDAFMEEDVRLEYRKDQHKLDNLLNKFREAKMNEKEVWATMTFFGLPYSLNKPPTK